VPLMTSLRLAVLALVLRVSAAYYHGEAAEDEHWIRANHHWNPDTKAWEHQDHDDTDHSHDYDLSEGFEEMDANKDGVLIAEEIEPHMSELNEIFGKDHGGDPDEEHRWHVATGSHWIDHGPMVAWDTDGDGKITEEEYLNFAEPRIHARRMKSDFYFSDDDKNGFLSIKEFQRSGVGLEIAVSQTEKHLGNPDVTEEAAMAHAFAKIDENHDHKISAREYVHSLHSRDDFSRKDANGDGRLTKKEYVDYEHVHGLHIDKHAGDLFDIMDRTRDGVLTRLEHNKRGIDILHHMSSVPDPVHHIHHDSEM